MRRRLRRLFPAAVSQAAVSEITPLLPNVIRDASRFWAPWCETLSRRFRRVERARR